MMSVPVMSDGIRSGVNWMRLNLRSRTRASVAMSSVFARPGTPTMRSWRPTKSDSRISSMTSLCPMIRLPSSVMICCRPTFILSASARSSGDSKSTVLSSTRFPLECVGPMGPWGGSGRTDRSPQPSLRAYPPTSLVCHPVNDVVHAELVRFVRLVDRFESRVRPLPVLRDVGVVVDHHHDPLRRIVVLVDRPEYRRRRIVILRHVERLDFEKRVEDRVVDVEVVDSRLRQHAEHLRLEVAPVRHPEVVDDHEAALLQKGAQAERLLIGHHPAAGLAQVGNRVLEQFRIVEGDDVGLLRVRVQVGQLVHDLHEVLFAGRIVVRPRQALRREAVIGAVADPHEGEPAVVRGVGPDLFTPAAPAEPAAEAATTLRQHRGGAADGQDRDERADDRAHYRSFFACRSRIAFVLRARSVSSFSICSSYWASGMLPLRSFNAAIWRSIASFSSTSFLIAGSLVSATSAESARPMPRNIDDASCPSLPSSIVACSVSSSPFCWNACTTLAFANSNASASDTWPLRSRSADGSLKAATKNSGNCVSFRSPPVLVAVITTRPGAAIAGRKAPLELLVLMNPTCCAGSLSSSFDHSATVR